MYIAKKTFGCDLRVRELRNFGRRFCLKLQDLRLTRIAMGNPRDCGTSAGCKPWSAWQARAIIFFFLSTGCTAVFAEMGGFGDQARLGSREKRVCVCVHCTAHSSRCGSPTKPTWQRSNATPPRCHAMPRHARARAVPRVGGWVPTSCQSWRGSAAEGSGGCQAGGFSEASIGNGVAPEGWAARIIQIAQRLCPTQSTARNSPRWTTAGAVDGSHGALLLLVERVCWALVPTRTRVPLPRTGIFCWTRSTSLLGLVRSTLV